MTNSQKRPELTKEEIEEREHFQKVIASFKDYKTDSTDRLARSHVSLKRLSFVHQQRLINNGFKTKLEDLGRCVELNSVVLNGIIEDAPTMFDNSNLNGENVDADGNPSKSHGNEQGTKARDGTSPGDIDKIQSTLKQLVRDWSDVGREEREMCYNPILKELENLYPSPTSDSSSEKSDSGIEQTSNTNTGRSNIKILVPGAGLGRLAWDIAKRGFECQGNEFSLYMLFASNFVLNRCKTRNCTEIYPWIHQFTNNFSKEDMTASVSFPDVDPGELQDDAKFSMVAGDFLEVYANAEYENSKDVVVTCFFLDTAHNVLDYIELIYKILKPGGYWINLGPLLYHFADIPREPSIEPPYDIVRNLITLSGFEFIREKLDQKAKYCQNPKSMLQYYYNCIYFTCVKK